MLFLGPAGAESVDGKDRQEHASAEREQRSSTPNSMDGHETCPTRSTKENSRCEWSAQGRCSSIASRYACQTASGFSEAISEMTRQPSQPHMKTLSAPPSMATRVAVRTFS